MNLPKKNINLLPRGDLEKKPWGRFLKWALHWGRHIIVFTELIVVLSFVYRFKLDRDLATLHNSVNSKQQLVESFSELENNARFLQQRLSFIQQKEAESLRPTDVLDQLNKLTPVDVFFTELELKKGILSIKGSSLSNTGLNTLINSLKANKQFTQINLSSIKSKGQQNAALQFELSTTIKEE